jgi:single-stranded DNA-binding protein
MNECHFIGRLIGTPKIDDVDINGKKVAMCKFTLKVDRKHRNANGENTIRPQFLDFEIWDSAAETIYKNCRSGETIIIDRASACSYPGEDKDGNKINRIYFRVDKFSFKSTILPPPKKAFSEDYDGQ